MFDCNFFYGIFFRKYFLNIGINKINSLHEPSFKIRYMQMEIHDTV